MGKLGDAFLAIVPQLDDSAMSGAVSGIQGKLSGAANAGKVAFAAVGAAATAAAGYVVKSALDGYSAYEQNLGGIQKIFGNMGKGLEEYASLTGQSVDECAGKWRALEDSQNAMLANADQAWQTAGLSASAYMEQATSFGASLVSSLGGDTQKAVEYANTALVDMSDNANTFGTNIEDIQNAYQGFAKQNYTMLDNLKLGYGGTKEEMQRLVQDAAAVSDAVDADSLSFDNCVQAIHVMQEQLNVSGTTAREASTTIEGSVNSMKAAWENWLTGLGNQDADLSQLTSNLVTAFENVSTNVIPRVSVIVSTLAAELPGLVAEVGPTLAASLQELFGSAVEAVEGSLPDEIKGLVEGFDAIGTAVQSSGIADTIANIFDGLGPAAQGMADSVDRLATDFADILGPALQAVSPLLQSLADAVTLVVTNLDQIAPVVATVAAGFAAFSVISTVVSVVAGFVSVLAPVASAVGMVVSSIMAGAPVFGTLAAAIGLVVSPATLVVAGIAAVVAAIVAFATNAGGCRDTVTAAFQAVCDFVGTLPETIGGFLQSVVDAIASWAGNVVSSAAQAGSQFIGNIVSFFSQLPGNVAGFLASAIGSIASFVGSAASSAVSAGSSFLSGISGGFNSAVSFVSSIPSRILGALGNVGSLLWDAGSSIINGLLNGLKGAIGGVYNFVSGIAGTIASLKGPLPYDRKLLIPNGRAIMDSLYAGLEGGYGEVLSLVSGMADGIAGSLGEVAASVTVAPAAQVASTQAEQAAQSNAVLEWLDANLGDIIASRTPYTGMRDFDRLARRAVARA